MARSSDSFFLLAIFKDKTFQAQEVKRVVYLSGIYLLVSTVLLAVFYQQMLGQLISGSAPMLFVAEDVNLINEQIPAMSSVLGKWMLIMLVINVVITSTVGVYILRKLGHPLMALKRALREIGEGKLDAKLRESDSAEFSEITEAFNGALLKINEKILEAKNQLDTIDSQPEPDREALRESVKNCSQVLEYFQTVNVDDLNGQSKRAS